MDTTFIYALMDPRDNQVRYVGKSNEPRRRFSKHLRAAQDCPRIRWIRALQRLNLEPGLEILEEVYKSAWEGAEQSWIAYFLHEGADLTNMTGGGDAPPIFRGPHSEEARIRIGSASTGRALSEESCDKIRRAKLGKPRDEETRAKISATLTGRKTGPLSEEHKHKISEALKGRVFSIATRAKISLANKNRGVSEETKRKISDALKEREFTAEHREKISDALKGRQFDGEWRECLSRSHVKLADSEIEKIIVLLNGGELLQYEIAQSFGVSPSCITRIKNRTNCYARFD